MREHWVAEGDADGAIRHGLHHTAGVITGSAAIMTAVFLAFAGADVIPLRQFGVGLTIAVLLDATIVRLVLLPAIMRITGPRIWWMPDWLARRLPDLEPAHTDPAGRLASAPAQRPSDGPAAYSPRAEYIRWRQATGTIQ